MYAKGYDLPQPLLIIRYGKYFKDVQPRVVKTLIHSFLDPTKPLTTHYGIVHSFMANQQVPSKDSLRWVPGQSSWCSFLTSLDMPGFLMLSSKVRLTSKFKKKGKSVGRPWLYVPPSAQTIDLLGYLCSLFIYCRPIPQRRRRIA